MGINIYMGTIYIYTYSMTSDGLIMVNGYKVTVFLSTDVAGGESFALEHLKKYMELGTPGKPWETLGKQWENHGKTMGNNGKTMGNPRKTMGNNEKTMRKQWGNPENNGKTMGKPWENGICG